MYGKNYVGPGIKKFCGGRMHRRRLRISNFGLVTVN